MFDVDRIMDWTYDDVNILESVKGDDFIIYANCYR